MITIRSIGDAIARPAVIGALALAAAACATTPSTAPGAAPSGAYQLDPAHASLVWTVAHAGGMSGYVARFDRFDAALDFDSENPTASHLDVAIEAASVSTGDPDFDAQIARAVLIIQAYSQDRKSVV